MIVPGIAKSGGTVIAISANNILLGVNSELGPIDPQFLLSEYGNVPCQIIAGDETSPPILRAMAEQAVSRMHEFASKILCEGMLKGKKENEQKRAIEQLTDSSSYGSHGAVIDFSEAQQLGLTVQWMEPTRSYGERFGFCIVVTIMMLNSRDIPKSQKDQKTV